MRKPILFKLVLFGSSYVPLIWIICLQLAQKSIDITNFKFTPFILDSWGNIFNAPYINWIIGLLGFSLFLILTLALFIKLNHDPNLEDHIEAFDIANLNSSYITNYLSVYIFPFITLNMTKLDGLGTLLIFLLLIGYVYIKNDILYINPVLNIIFKYNIYSITITSINDSKIEVILLSRQSHVDLRSNPHLSIQSIGDNIFIDHT